MVDAAPHLNRAERIDGWLSRRLPKLGPRLHRLAYELSGGRLGSRKRKIPVGLLTTTGRRSGRPRVTPVMCLDEGTHVYVVASNAGRVAPPGWLLNLMSQPDAQLRLGAEIEDVRARLLSSGERAECWPRLVAQNPLFADFQARTGREIAVVALERPPDGSAAGALRRGPGSDRLPTP